MINHDEAFDLKFAPEFGQAAEEESEDLVPAEDAPTEDEDADEYEDDEEESEDDDTDDAEELEILEDEDEESVPLGRYNELRKSFTQRSMELAEIKRSMLTTPPTPEQAPQKPPQGVMAKSLEDIVDAKVNTRLETLLAPIREQEEELALQSSIIALAEADDDFQEVSPLFLKQLEASPALFNIEGGLQIAYRAAKSEYLERVSAARVKAETTAALQRKQMKENATDGSSYTRPTQSKATSEADIIRDSILGLGVRKTF